MLNDEQRRFIVTKIETIEENIACQKLVLMSIPKCTKKGIYLCTKRGMKLYT